MNIHQSLPRVQGCAPGFTYIKPISQVRTVTGEPFLSFPWCHLPYSRKPLVSPLIWQVFTELLPSAGPDRLWESDLLLTGTEGVLPTTH